MPDIINNAIIDDAVAEALQLDLSFLSGPGQARHVPFAFTACPIPLSSVATLETAAALLGRLTQVLASDADLVQELHAPLAKGDPFFAELISIHKELHCDNEVLPRIPLLLQRSDFMLDAKMGPQLVECNSIAAGMAPFGEQVHLLHQYLQTMWPQEVGHYSACHGGHALPNPATSTMAQAIVVAAEQVRGEFSDGTPSFLMVIQESEDNIFDQRLLERELQRRGIRTCRRTFRQLHDQLATGPNQRLLLEGFGSIDVVYLRAGYQYQDYIAKDLDARRCCDALRAVRIFLEKHRVALNATVSQQLATSKRMQQYLATDPNQILAHYGFTASESNSLKGIFAEMIAVDNSTSSRLRSEMTTGNWVLKNQGEGGGHCLFDMDILTRLDALDQGDFPAWVLMRRLHPTGRVMPTLMVREGRGQQVDRLVSEIGIFTAHLEDRPLVNVQGHCAGYVGYLVRSKPPGISEGGVHSGFGMLDSLVTSVPDE
ncbi:MAG: glutathione synthase [Halieaceae bacterium]|jgi:glutathione synthase|nr:glutathione synthase [Halieaceae bacterium]